MLKTERMKQVVVAGARPHLVPVIDTLHALKALHVEEHTPDDFFGLGSPLPEGEQVAEAMLKARGLEKSLGLEEARAAESLASVDAAFAVVAEVETAVADLIEERAQRVEEQKALEAEVARLDRLSGLGLRLEEMAGYTSINAYIGTVATDPTPAIRNLTDRFEIQTGPAENGLVMALFVAKDADIEAALAESGFHAVEVPTGEGPVDTAVGQRITQARQAAARIEAIDAELAEYRARHGDRLLAASETLAGAAERAGAPLRFASSSNSFVVSGWVPTKRTAETERALQRAADQRLHIEWAEPASGGHGHDEHDEHVEEDPAADPPVKFAHKRNDVKSFTMLLGMHSLPKYKELDPTILMWVTFPIFFGLMVGDVAFGVLIGLLAWFFKRHYIFGIGGPRVSRMLMLGAIWTFLIGLFMFGEAFGIHFVDAPGTLSWEHLLHADWSQYYASAQHTAVSAATEGANGHAEDGHHKVPHLSVWGVQLGYFSKLHDVIPLMVISLAIAVIHLNIAILMGVRNMWVLHGAKHAIFGRVSWLVLELGVLGIAYGSFDAWPLVTNLGWAAFVLAVIMLLIGEGAIAILELPKIFSNALSYTRLTAVGLSKAGMTLAVNTFAFTMTTDHTASLNGPLGFLLALVGYVVILLLGVLAGGLHSMRLQLVEFFGWFYEGGGRPFKAFGDPANRNA